MNTILWIVQIILCIKFLSTAYSHGIQTRNPKIEQSKNKLGGASSILHKILSAVMAVDSVALILPGLAAAAKWMLIPSLILLIVLILLSIVFHVLSREKPLIVADVVLLALAVFAWIGRWLLSPV
jgi:hypothetical protein